MAKKKLRGKSVEPVEVPTNTSVLVTFPNGNTEERGIVRYEQHSDGAPNYSMPVPYLADDESLARFSNGTLMILKKIKKAK